MDDSYPTNDSKVLSQVISHWPICDIEVVSQERWSHITCDISLIALLVDIQEKVISEWYYKLPIGGWQVISQRYPLYIDSEIMFMESWCLFNVIVISLKDDLSKGYHCCETETNSKERERCRGDTKFHGESDTEVISKVISIKVISKW